MSAADADRLILAKARKGKATPLEAVLQVAQAAAVPVALGVYLLRRWMKHRKEQKGKPKPASGKQQSAAAAASAARSEKAKARRNYKVKRDEVGQMLAQDGEEYPDVQPSDDTMEVYNEDEVDNAGAAAAGGAPPNQMIDMLKQ